METRKKKILIKKAVFILLVLTLTFSEIFPAYADLGTMSPKSAMDEILKDLGVNKGELKNTVKTFNVSRLKKNPPQVSILFDPANPVPGEKITATAMPMYFMNDSKELYFTWYLRNAECRQYENNNTYRNASAATKTRIKKICDLNEDGTVEIEDYKIKAARARVNNGYDKDGAAYSRQERIDKGLSVDGDQYKAIIGGNDQSGKTDHCFYHDVKSGEEYELSGCDNGQSMKGHLFPYSYSMDDTGKIKQDRYQVACRGCCCSPPIKMGEGLFDIVGTGCRYTCFGDNAAHERFWQSNPDDPDTGGYGTADEATIIGLGATEFSWTYLADDEVGVVVEGVSVEPTQNADSSYKTMWAFSKNDCDLRNLGITQKDLEDGIVSVQALNKCLIKNFVSPSEETGINSKMDISLTYDPISPINDSSTEGQSGDEISFIASALNVDDQTYLSYQWEVFLADSMNPLDWGDALIKDKLPEASQTSGIGVNTFKFNMNLKDDVLENNKYMKVRVIVTNPKSKKSTDRGNAEVIVPILSSTERIKVYSALISDDLTSASFGEKEICMKEDPDGNPTSFPEATCRVYRNEIIGLKIADPSKYTDFYWTIDGKPAECTFSGVCGANDEGYSGISFFPVLKEVDHSFTATMEAINKNNGEKVSLSRSFLIVEPGISIVSADENTSHGKLLGNFVDLDNREYPDYDKSNFEALANNEIKLKAVPSAGSSSKTTLTWYINDEPVDGNNYVLENNTVKLPGKSTNELYDVILSADYIQDTNTKKALNKYWGVNYNDFYEKQSSASVRIIAVDSFSGTISETTAQRPTPKKIFATMASGLPSYLAFLLRIILSVGLILFVVRIIFSFAPNIKKDGNQ